VEALLAAEARLDRSFQACLLVAVVGLGWPTYLHLTGQEQTAFAGPIAVSLLAVFFAAYAWFAHAVAVATRALGRGRLPYVAWLVAAPVLWLLLPVPVVATLILASPLSLKLRLSADLRAAIHDRTLGD
jgi:hypothetical protein